MGNRFARPGRKSVRKNDTKSRLTRDSSGNRRQRDGLILTNRSTQRLGITNDRCKEVTNRKFIFTSRNMPVRPSRIPVAAWRSTVAPEPIVTTTDKHGVDNDTALSKKGHADDEQTTPSDGDDSINPSITQNEITGDVDVKKGKSYTIMIWGKLNRTSPTKPKPVIRTQTNKAVFKQLDRLQIAEANRLKFLQTRIQKARQCSVRQHDNDQRRLAVSAEQRKKYETKQEHREKAVIKEEIHRRMDTFKRKVRFFKTDRQ